MFRRQVAQDTEEPIADELLANIPEVAKGPEDALFETMEDDVIIMGPPPAPAPTPHADAPAPAAPGALAGQLRAQMGDAFAAELDRAESAIAGVVADLEAQLASERAAREMAEARLAEFKKLALR